MAWTTLRTALFGVTVAAVVGTGAAHGQSDYWSGVAEEVAVALSQSVAAYQAGDVDGAKRAAITAYFGVFESRKLEAALRKEMGQKHTVAVESQFGQIRKSIGSGAPAEDLARTVTALSDVLREDAKRLDERGMPAHVFNTN